MKHLLIRQNKDGKGICKRKLSKITDSQGQSIKFNHDEIIISDKYDLALIPISEQKNVKALDVSKEPLELGEKLFGVSLRETGFVAIDCMIHELKDLFAESNAGGTHGFSGMSYGNSSGIQRGLHKGQGEMNQLDDGGDEYSGFKEAQEDFSEKCKKAFGKSTKKLIDSCVEANIEFVKIAARNPRTRIVEAYHLYETKNNGKLLKNVKLPKC